MSKKEIFWGKLNQLENLIRSKKMRTNFIFDVNEMKKIAFSPNKWGNFFLCCFLMMSWFFVEQIKKVIFYWSTCGKICRNWVLWIHFNSLVNHFWILQNFKLSLRSIKMDSIRQNWIWATSPTPCFLLLSTFFSVISS